jgi:HPt (histidine-containing phosphotransfer) domain-containing protein
MAHSERTEPVFDESVLSDITSAAGIAPWELIEMFLDDARQSVATILQTSATADLESVNRTAHTLKSSAGSVGAMCIAQISRELEAATKSSLPVIDTNACTTLGVELQQAFDEFCRVVESDRERLSA